MVGSGYQLGTLIGRGSTGEVWAGEASDDGRPVAVKILNADLAADLDAVARFVQEGQVLTAVRSPHLVKVHDLIAGEDTLGIVMDLVDGPDLHTYLRRFGTLRPALAAALIGQVLGALSVVHRAGLVHRDIKPENILIDLSAPGRPRALLSDFGIAMITGDPAETGTGLAGTLPYLAPEIVRSGRASPASDLYSTGVVLYELLAGRTPFESSDPQEIMRAHQEDRPPVIPGLAPAMQALLDGLLAKNPAARPPSAISARQLLAQAGAAVGSAPALTPMPSAATAYRGPTIPPTGSLPVQLKGPPPLKTPGTRTDSGSIIGLLAMPVRHTDLEATGKLFRVVTDHGAPPDDELDPLDQFDIEAELDAEDAEDSADFDDESPIFSAVSKRKRAEARAEAMAAARAQARTQAQTQAQAQARAEARVAVPARVARQVTVAVPMAVPVAVPDDAPAGWWAPLNPPQPALFDEDYDNYDNVEGFAPADHSPHPDPAGPGNSPWAFGGSAPADRPPYAPLGPEQPLRVKEPPNRWWLLPAGLAVAAVAGLITLVVVLGNDDPIGSRSDQGLPTAALPESTIPAATTTPGATSGARPTSIASPKPSATPVQTSSPAATAAPSATAPTVKLVPMPKLTGKSLTAANSLLSARGLGSATVTKTCSGSAPEGRVLTQSPSPGTKVTPSASISVTVQDDCAIVPDVVGMSLGDAVAKLRELGFQTISRIPEAEGGTMDDVVTIQYPPASSSQPKDTQIYLRAPVTDTGGGGGGNGNGGKG